MIYLINLIELDPTNHDSANQIAKEISLFLADLSRHENAFHPIFVISPSFANQFRDWLGVYSDNFYLIPYDGSLPARPLLTALQPQLIISPLSEADPFFGVDQFKDVPRVLGVSEFSGETGENLQAKFTRLSSKASQATGEEAVKISSTTVPMIPLSAALAEISIDTSGNNVADSISAEFRNQLDILADYLVVEEKSRFNRIPIIGKFYRAYTRLRLLPHIWDTTTDLLRSLVHYQVQIESKLESLEQIDAHQKTRN